MNLLSVITLTTGMWRAVLMTPGGELPFNMRVDSVQNSYTLTVINGEEEILLDDISIIGDSLIARFPVYETELRLKMVDKNKLEGTFVNLTRATNGVIPVKAEANQRHRFPVTHVATGDPDGKWAVTFSPGTKDSSFAVGVFKQSGADVTGTFLTTTGDYRYLAGVMTGDSLLLSTFNGTFVYLFKARIHGDSLSGMYYSGTHWQEPFEGVRNAKAGLPDPTTLTSYNESKGPLTIRWPDADGNMVSLDDDRFRGKVVVIQILGSWCPNCLDESLFLAPYYDRNHIRGVEMIGLAFEKTDDNARAAANVKRLVDRLNIHYPVLVVANRSKVKTVLPGLENFISFPTTIFLDKEHSVRRVHAGFSGAATGEEYEKYKDDFSRFVDKLLAE